ncbi:MAG: manganese efflux pump, partial [Cyanobacteria bacterium]|nr:manganese efflux pump [Cyanobacteriota bacterium]
SACHLACSARSFLSMAALLGTARSELLAFALVFVMRGRGIHLLHETGSGCKVAKILACIMVIEIILFAAILSIDSFSAAFAMGFRRFSARRAFSFAFSSAFAEGAATAVGFLLGKVAKDLIVDYDHWVAFFLLVAVGIHMCWEAYHHDPDGEEDSRTHGFWKIIFISSVTSIDSLGVGVTLGLADKPIVPYSLAIAGGAFISTYLGLNLAKRLPSAFGSRLEILGGAVLIAMDFKMLSV